MQPNGRRVLGIALLAVAAGAAMTRMLRSSGTKAPAVQAAEQGLQTAELERRATAARAAAVVTRAAEARAATKPVLARAEDLRSRVTVERAGQLRVQDTIVPVPPLVTARIQADSAAISALSVALTVDAEAAAAQEERLLAEARARDAARLTITSLEQERRPRCGRRCGMLLGAASIVALGIAVDHTRRLFSP